MNRKRLFALIGGLVIAGLLVSIGAAFAQGDPKGLQRPLGSDTDRPSLNSTLILGQPGLSFAYTSTLGTTGVPYIYDHEHLYTPGGLGAFQDQIWIVEYWGERVQKFNSDGSYGGVELGGAGTPIPDVSWLTDVTIDAAGNAWVAEAFSSLVSVFDPDGNFIKELGRNGEFFNPSSVAFDSQGNIYIADGSMPFPFPNGNQRIEIYSSSEEYINTIGVTGETGADNDHFNNPSLIAIDSQDRLYVADRLNHRVQIFDVSEPLTPTYTATLGVIGECNSDNDHLCRPQGVAVDDSFIYVADTDNGRVQIFDILTRAYVATMEGGASDVAIDDDGNIYISGWNSIVQQYDSSRNYVRTYGVENVPYLTDGDHFNFLASLASTPDQGLLVLEGLSNRLVELDAQGDLQWTMGTVMMTGCGDLYDLCMPDDVTADTQGYVYLANEYIRIYDIKGVYLDAIGSFNDPGAGEYQFNNPTGVAVAADGTVYVADSGNQRVQVYDSDWDYLDTLGETGVSGDDNAHFNDPTDVVVDSLGNLYVADQDNFRVQVFDATRAYLRTIGEPGDNFGQFQDDMQLAVDAQDRLYVTDESEHVQVFDASGAFLTSIGGSFRGGLAVDASGKLYLARGGNFDIQVFSPGVPGWRQANINGFGDRYNVGVVALEVFDGQLYATSGNWNSGAQVWRMETGGDWTAVSEPGFGSVYTNTNPAIPDMIVFDGQLYAGTAWGGVGPQLWRSTDGETWAQIEDNGFDNADSIAMSAFGIFDGILYASTQNLTNGLEIWRSATGDSDDWTQVVTAGNGSVGNSNVTSLIEFQDGLYAVVENLNDGAEIWRTEDGLDWTRIITGGFGDSGNIYTGGFAIFAGELYVGTYNDVTGAQLFRTADGTNWDAVIEDGFGDVNNVKIDMLFSYGGNLYAGTSNATTGLEMWQSTDGEDWIQANPDGFGDVYNGGTLWSSAVTSYHGSLYLGTWNGGNGGEVWQLLMYQTVIPLVVR